MKPSNHRIDRAMRKALEDFSPGIPMPWTKVSASVKEAAKAPKTGNMPKGAGGGPFAMPVVVGLVSVAGAALFWLSSQKDETAKMPLPPHSVVELQAIEQHITRKIKASSHFTPDELALLTEEDTPGDEEENITDLNNRRGNTRFSNELTAPVDVNDDNGNGNDPVYDDPANVLQQEDYLSLGMIDGKLPRSGFNLNDRSMRSQDMQPVRSRVRNRGNFYLGFSMCIEQMRPKQNFYYDHSRTHKDYEGVAKAQQPMGNGNSYSLHAGYMFTPRMGVETGLTLSMYSQDVHFEYTYKEAPLIDVNTGEIVGYYDLPASSQQHFKYDVTNTLSLWRIPVKLFYRQPLGTRLYAEAGGGVTYNITGKANSRYFNLEKLKTDTLDRDNYEPLTLSASAHTGLYWVLGLKTTVGIEGNVSRFITPLQISDQATITPGMRSLKMSLRITL